MLTKKLFLFIPLALTSCVYDYGYGIVPTPVSISSNATYDEVDAQMDLTDEIRYLEAELQRENKKRYYNLPYSHYKIEDLQRQLKYLYLRRSEIECYSRCNY